MNAKKILTALLALTLAATPLAACQRDNGAPSGEEQTTDAPVDKTPVVVEDEGTDFWKTMNAGFENAVLGAESDFEIETVNGEVTILSYKGTEEHLRVPATIGGLPVTAIADGAFAVPMEEPKDESQENDQKENQEEEKAPQLQLKTLILPESITALGEGILARCESLHSLQTPLMGASKESTQYLGYLFGATTHADNARDVPDTLKCFKLTGEWQALPAFSLFDCNDLVCLELPETLTVIEKFALFNGASLRQIDGLERITVFGDRALMDCSALQSVTLADELEAVGFGTFEGCKALRSMTLPFVGHTPGEHTYLGYLFGASQPDFAKGFYPADLCRITLRNTCRTLGDYAFYQCETLKEITLPEGLESIGVRAFYGCERLWSITFPGTLTTIREAAFFGCDALSAITFAEGLTTLGINTFYNCDSLTELTLPQSLKALPASCFAGCTALAKIDLGGVVEVGAQAFRHCNALAEAHAAGNVSFKEGNEKIEDILK